MIDKKYKEKAIQRLLSFRLIKENGCWIFTGALDGSGYGLIGYNHKLERAHRLAKHLFEDFDLESELLVLHKNICSSKACFNPACTYIGDHARNFFDLREKHPITHCREGHEFTKENTVKNRMGHRHCKICQNRRKREYDERKRNKAARKLLNKSIGLNKADSH